MSAERPPGDALQVARDFVGAVAWGEHRLVWELLGTDGRTAVLRVATVRGMDAVCAARLREGTATPEAWEQFLTDLVRGLRTDLQGTDLDTIGFVLDVDSPSAPSRARVLMSSPLPEALGGALPVGSLELSRHAEGWRVDRLVPRPQP